LLRFILVPVTELQQPTVLPLSQARQASPASGPSGKPLDGRTAPARPSALLLDLLSGRPVLCFALL